MADTILVIDEGTTSTRAMLFAAGRGVPGAEQRELTQYYPRPGWVEHDAEEIWEREPRLRAGGGRGGGRRGADRGDRDHQPARDDRASGRGATGRALAPAIVWQDRRTAELCARLKASGHEAAVQAQTGLLLDPYFSALEDRLGAGELAASSTAAGRRSVRRHGRELAGLPADRRPACQRCDQRLAHRFDGHPDRPLGRRAARPVRRAARGRCRRSSTAPGRYGETLPDLFGARDPDLRHGRRPAGGGDRPGLPRARRHQGDLWHRRLRPHPYRARAAPVSRTACCRRSAWQLGGERRYALEGSVFVAGSLIKWLRDDLGLLATRARRARLWPARSPTVAASRSCRP